MSNDIGGNHRFRKKILISYVRDEGQEYARQLKSILEYLGFNVFLDVDDIIGGDNWVDALNQAVLNCVIFIPLITSRYGLTKWTKREVILADLMNKQIIPISFLENWPPIPLAIQFAATHYIPWRCGQDNLPQGEGQPARDIRFWDELSIQKVAMAIFESSQSQQAQLDDDIMERNPFNSMASLGVIKEELQIVISAHPAQQHFVQFISKKLSHNSKFKVWSSTDITIGGFNSSDDNSMTQTVEDQSSNLFPDRVQCFKEKVDVSALVIIVWSDEYCKSITCKQEIFYCDTRKRVVSIKFKDFQTPEWLLDEDGDQLFDDSQKTVLENTTKDLDSFALQLNETVSEQINSKDILSSILTSLSTIETQN